MEGGKLYYLHLGYYKNASNNSGDDTFTINSINITLNDSDLYHAEVETNSAGSVIFEVPYGKYAVTEIEAPEGYILEEEPTIIEFRQNGIKEFTIENEKYSKVIVHHYKVGTREKIADDDILYGRNGEKYTSNPKANIKEHYLTQEDGEFVIPANSSGVFTEEEQEVVYYYEDNI